MHKTVILVTIGLISIILISSIGFTFASAEILNPKMVHAIMSNLVSAYGKTYHLQVENKTYNIYYGVNSTYAIVTNILLVPEHNSMQFSLKEVTETDSMWIQFPQNLISVQNNDFVLYVDGQEKRYEHATSDHSIIMGFMIPKNTTLIVIQGTHVVPEFSSLAGMIIAISIIGVIVLSRFRLHFYR